MLLYANLYVNALADFQTRAVHMVVTDECESEKDNIVNPPIKHELMHIVSMTAWGAPPNDNHWLNEGLATFAENNCSGFSVAAIYRFFLEEKLLVSIETLANNFYEVEEMVSYHQSAYIVEFLITKYGIPKFEAFWKSGFSNLENIYGVNASELEIAINNHILKLHPESLDINWESLKNGCK